MTLSLAATLLVSLRRMRAAWPIVLAAGLTCVLAASLLAAAPIYADAVSLAGLQRVLADAPGDEANIQVSLRVEPDRAAEADAAVSSELDRVLAGVGGSVARYGRSDSFDLPLAQPGPIPDLVELAYAEGLQDHATLAAGTWPDDTGSGAGTTDPIPVAVADQVATPLGIATGDVLQLDSRIREGFEAPVRIVGIFRIDDPTAAYWWDEPQVLDGLVASDDYATHGPFFTTRDRLLSRATVSRTQLVWRAFPDTGNVTIEDIDGLRTRIGGLGERIGSALPGIEVTVATGLPDILTRADRSLLVSRAGVLLLIVQLAILAAYAVLLSAALLVEHRRMDTAMLRSRGAGPLRLAALTLVEALLLTVPAAAIAPWLAVAALEAFNHVGPLAAIGLQIQPVVSVEAYLAAAAGAVGCLIALVLPALPTRRSFASVQRGVSRGSTTPPSQRIGLDIALVAIAAIGLWQLRLYGAPITGTVQGAIGIDPLLVAAPAIGMLAGAVVALRVLPLLAGVIERAAARGRGLVSALGARQLARRPLRYTRTALLLMLAMAMGVFAASYAWTWTASQADQAGYQVGADVRVEPGRRTGALPRWGLDQAYAAIPGLTGRMPVSRSPVEASRSARGSILALDAAEAPSIVTFRADLADAPLEDLMAPVAAGRPALYPVRLAGEPRRLRLDVGMEIPTLERLVFDPATGETSIESVDQAVLAGRDAVTASVVVRDATGALYRFGGESAPPDGERHPLIVPLGDPGEEGVTFAVPLEILAVEVGIHLPAGYQAPDATVTVHGAEAATADGPWQAVSLSLGGGWRASASVYGSPSEPVAGRLPGETLSVRAGVPGLAGIPGIDQYGRGTTLVFAPADLDAIGEAAIPALASDAFLEASARSVGETMSLDIAGTRRTVELVGSVHAFPTVDLDEPVLVIDQATLALVRFEGDASVDPASEWWFDVEDGAHDAVVQALEDPPIDSRLVLSSVDRARALATDPVALGIIGALTIGFVAAALFAVVGFIVSAAVSARERVTEFALLRALGLSSSQLSGWLSLENAVLALVSLVAGTALGLVIAWVVLPFVTVTQEAGTPYPPVIVEVPWSTVAILEVVGIVALSTTVIVLAWLLRRIGLASSLRTGED